MQVLTDDLVIEESRNSIFTAGENQETSETHPTSDPADVAQRFLQHRAASVEEEVSSTVVLSEGMATFGNDQELLQQFLEELEKAKVLTKAEIAEGLTGKKSGSTLSKLKKIKEHRHVILHPKILPFLQPGYSVLYELALLYEDLKDVDGAIDSLHDLPQGNDGPATRDWLKKERVKLQPATRLSEVLYKQPKSHECAQDVEPSIKPEVHEIAQATSPAERVTSLDDNTLSRAQPDENADVVAESEPPIAALLLTASGRDASRLTKEGNRESLPRCLRISNDVGDKAVLLVCAKVGVLSSMSRAIESLKFGRCSSIYLLSEPTGPDVTECDALAIYRRGGFKLSSDVTEWPSDKSPISLADRLLADVTGRRVHLFAKSKTAGWESIIGEENWATEAEER